MQPRPNRLGQRTWQHVSDRIHESSPEERSATMPYNLPHFATDVANIRKGEIDGIVCWKSGSGVTKP